MRKVYTMGKKLIDFIDITKSYNGNVVLDDLNLYIRENEFLTLLGPSGCGKTTTLRMLGSEIYLPQECEEFGYVIKGTVKLCYGGKVHTVKALSLIHI